MKYTLAIFVTLLITAATACEKERLPKPSQRGRNIMAWRTDGEASVARWKSLWGNRASYRLDEDSVLQISGYGSENDNVTLRFRFEGLNIPLPLFVNQPTLSVDCGSTPVNCTYGTKNVSDGTVTVTYYDGDIIAGTFHADVTNDAGEVKRITDGRFDISLE